MDEIKKWHDIGKKYSPDNPECKPVRMLVSGVAGTGKSFLIEAISA